MKKVILHDPVIVAQSTTEPVFRGGYQDPFMRSSPDGTLYVRFNARMDTVDTFGLEEKNPVYKSTDEGKTWTKVTDPKEWTFATKPLSNGDRFVMRETKPILNIGDIPNSFPKVDESRFNISVIGGECNAYTIDEIAHLFNGQLTKEVYCNRIYAGTNEVVEETCKVNWPNMPAFDYKTLLRRVHFRSPKEDKNGVLWATCEAPYIEENGKAGSKRLCTHLLRSDDFGHTWDYVNTLVYKEEYNNPNCRDIEGFNECELEFLDDGSMIGIVRSGSLYPFPPKMGDKDHPAPLMYMFKTSDEGKTFDFIKPFYDYGICPVSVKLGSGTILLVSGRPGVYLRTCDDPKGEEWSDIIDIVKVPEEEVYDKYWHYTCCNCGVCTTNDNTAFMVYSDFTLNAPNGEKAKSILVRKITIE